MTSLVTPFCSILLILPLHRLFEQLGLIFTRYLWGVKMFNMTRGRFWQNIFLIPCLVLIYDVTCDVILLHFTNFTISSPIFATNGDFYEIFIIDKVVQHDQRKLLENMFLIPCLVFDLWRNLLASCCSVSLLLHRLFEQLDLIFTKYLWGVKLSRGTILQILFW